MAHQLAVLSENSQKQEVAEKNSLAALLKMPSRKFASSDDGYEATEHLEKILAQKSSRRLKRKIRSFRCHQSQVAKES